MRPPFAFLPTLQLSVLRFKLVEQVFTARSQLEVLLLILFLAPFVFLLVRVFFLLGWGFDLLRFLLLGLKHPFIFLLVGGKEEVEGVEGHELGDGLEVAVYVVKLDDVVELAGGL